MYTSPDRAHSNGVLMNNDRNDERSWLERGQPALLNLVLALGAAFLVTFLLYLAVR